MGDIHTINMRNNLSKLLHIVLFVAFLPCVAWSNTEKRNFTLVIDAGHGGHDAGAVGAYSKEKDINLRVALAFGQLVEENCSDVKVIYTRKKDVFIPLQRRADIANNNKADLFISVHTNALPAGRLAYGAETYSLGMARASANLAVAKRENAVITLENDYKTTYQGFDPNKAESYVIFEFMQDKYMKQSVDLASCIQKQYVSAGRPNKGVHQAGFLVLRNTSMPSVLTELGFITTPAEETYLNSQQGTMELSRSIYNGFLAYLRMHEKGVHDIPENLPTRMTADLPEPKVNEPAPAPMPTSVNNGEAAVVPVSTVPTPRMVEEPADNEVALISRKSNGNKRSTAKPVPTKAEPKREAEVAKVKTPSAQNKETTKTKEVTAKTKDNASVKPKENTTKPKDTTKPKETTSYKKEQATKAAAPQDKKQSSNSKVKDTQKDSKSKTTSATVDNTKKKTENKASLNKSAKKEDATTNKGKDIAKQTSSQKANNASAKSATKQKINYRIQVGAGKTEIPATDAQFKGLSISRIKEGSLYKYYYGSYNSYAEAQKALHTVKAKLSSAYIVATVNGKSTTVAEARAKEQEKK